MKLKHLFIHVVSVWFVFPLMQAFTQEAPVTIEALTTFESQERHIRKRSMTRAISLVIFTMS